MSLCEKIDVFSTYRIRKCHSFISESATVEDFRQKFPEHRNKGWIKTLYVSLLRYEYGQRALFKDFPEARSLYDRLIKKRFKGDQIIIPPDPAHALRTLKHKGIILKYSIPLE